MMDTSRAIEIEHVVIPADHREPEPGKVEVLADSIRHVGQLNPITVRDAPGGKYELIAGRNRLEACRSLGHELISAMVLDLDDLKAEAAEIAENLHRTPLRGHDFDRAVARWKQLYEAAHPPRAPLEKFSKGESPGKNGAEPAPRFDEHAAETLGVSDRKVRAAARRGAAFDDEDREVFQAKGIPATSLDPVAAIPEPEVRKAVVEELARQPEPDVKAAVEHVVGPDPELIESEQSDADWLATLPVRPKLADAALFDAEALAYRKLVPALQAFRNAARPFLGKPGRFLGNLKRVVEAKHPRDWLLCGTCDGSGFLFAGEVDTSPCPNCRGGYRVD